MLQRRHGQEDHVSPLSLAFMDKFLPLLVTGNAKYGFLWRVCHWLHSWASGGFMLRIMGETVVIIGNVHEILRRDPGGKCFPNSIAYEPGITASGRRLFLQYRGYIYLPGWH